MVSKLFTPKTSLVLFVTIVLAFIIRFYNPSTPPVFVDEAIYIRWAQVMRADETLRFLPLSDGKQPLFMWILIPFLKIIEDPLLAGRLVSTISGLGTIILTYLIAWSLFHKRRLAVLSSALVALSPYLVFYDGLALVDSFLTFWGMLTLLFGILLVKNPRLDLALLTGAALGGAWLTKSPGELFFVLLPTALLLSKKSKLTDKKRLFKIIGSLLIAWTVGIGFYNILRLGPNFHMIDLRNRDYIYSFSELMKHPGSPLLSNLRLSVTWFAFLLPLPFFLAALIGLISGLLTTTLTTIFISGWAFIPLFISASLGKVFTARYILYTLPPLLILTAFGIDKFLNQSKSIRAILLLLISAPVFFQVTLLAVSPARAWIPRGERSGYLEEWTAGYGLREIADFLKSRPAQTPILIGTEGYFGTLPDGLEIYLNSNRNIRFVGLDFPIKSVPQPLTNSLKDNEVYLVANLSRFKIPFPEKEGLILLASFPRPSRSDGTHDTTLFFRVSSPTFLP